MDTPRPTTLLWVIRHGQTASNRTGRIQGQSHIPLDTLGLAQAKALQPVVGALPWDVAISSDLKRAVQTAELALGPEAADRLILEPSLRERSLGVLEGQSYDDLDPAVRQALRDGSGQLDDAEGGEPWLAFRQRCVEALEALGTRWRGQRVVVFTHGGVMRHWFAHVVGLPPETTRFAFSTTNASVSELRLGDRGWWIHTWGHHDHLKDLGYLSW